MIIIRSYFFRSAIIGAASLLLVQRLVRVGNCHGFAIALHRSNRLPVLAHRPFGVVQVSVQFLFERNVAAAAELVTEGNGFSIFQNKASVIVHQLGVVVLGGGVLCVYGVLQLTACGGAVIRDFLLIGCKAGHRFWHRFGNEGKVPEIDVAAIVIAHADGFDLAVKTVLRFHLVQVQLYGDPCACLHFDRAIRCAVNA